MDIWISGYNFLLQYYTNYHSIDIIFHFSTNMKADVTL